MIVVDASAMVEALVGTESSGRLLDAFIDDLHAPALLDIEVMSVLRGLNLGRRLGNAAADEAWRTFCDLPISRYPFDVLAERSWTLRHQFTTYDASYLALAEALGAPLVTCDRKLATMGSNADVHMFSASS